MTSRRAFLASVAAAIAGAALPKTECALCKGNKRRLYTVRLPSATWQYEGDCDACRDRALWVPGKKLISVLRPRPPRYMIFPANMLIEWGVTHVALISPDGTRRFVALNREPLGAHMPRRFRA